MLMRNHQTWIALTCTLLVRYDVTLGLNILIYCRTSGCYVTTSIQVKQTSNVYNGLKTCFLSEYREEIPAGWLLFKNIQYGSNVGYLILNIKL